MNLIIKIWRWLNGCKTDPMPEDRMVKIAFVNASMCIWCQTISNSTGDECPECLQRGTLENFKRKIYEMSFFKTLEEEVKN